MQSQPMTIVNVQPPDNTPVTYEQWRQWMTSQRDVLLRELADVERQLGTSPTTADLRQAWREGRVLPARS